jgi:hypothetical protein
MTLVKCDCRICKYNKDGICSNEEITLKVVHVKTDYAPAEYTDCHTFQINCPVREKIIDFENNRPPRRVDNDKDLE